jgi:hypothetical protein
MQNGAFGFIKPDDFAFVVFDFAYMHENIAVVNAVGQRVAFVRVKDSTGRDKGGQRDHVGSPMSKLPAKLQNRLSKILKRLGGNEKRFVCPLLKLAPDGVIETPSYIRVRALLILGNVFPSELKS